VWLFGYSLISGGICRQQWFHGADSPIKKNDFFVCAVIPHSIHSHTFHDGPFMHGNFCLKQNKEATQFPHLGIAF
jgi:hypothetical protein